ncbi:RNA 2'-phosphotransferase [Hymenobacter humi]|uniref:RNA 2'-phosphotransferase n=1 Tax=Hymenobacter humi TaxID=1411620 RepID=A0ABW2U879_9BACT
MDSKQAIRLSKYLSRHLRHAPGAIGLQLQEGGWVDVDELLAACAAHGGRISREQLAQPGSRQRQAALCLRCQRRASSGAARPQRSRGLAACAS